MMFTEQVHRAYPLSACASAQMVYIYLYSSCPFFSWQINPYQAICHILHILARYFIWPWKVCILQLSTPRWHKKYGLLLHWKPPAHPRPWPVLCFVKAVGKPMKKEMPRNQRYHSYIWVNYNISLSWIVGPFGDDSPY